MHMFMIGIFLLGRFCLGVVQEVLLGYANEGLLCYAYMGLLAMHMYIGLLDFTYAHGPIGLSICMKAYQPKALNGLWVKGVLLR